MAGLEEVLARESRAQLVMACGTGKTLVGRWYAQRVQAALTVVVVPSLSLVAQTLGEWRAAGGWSFEALITCSDPSTADGVSERASGDGQDVGAPFWARLRARVTTSAAVVAGRLGGHSAARPLVVFSTYHSVHVVARAARSVGVAADLVIADEAHTLAGRPRAEFTIVLGDELPARSRVFMTATPVRADGEFDGYAADGAPISMADESLFGPVAYRLGFAEAIAAGLLADYRVVVYETAGQRLTPDPVAALAVAAEHGLSSVLSFHGRVAKAQGFAAAIDGLVLPDGRTVAARAVAGIDPVRQRQQALAMLASARPDQLVVISSARCLSAGVDIPAVDGILFADPKYSDVDVIQSVGRALRPAPGKTDGLVMIPVCVPSGLDDDTVLSTGAFSAVWRILRGLRVMDARLSAELAAVSRPPSRRGESDGSRAASRVLFDLPSRGAEPGRFVARVVDYLSPEWDKTLREVEDFAAEHGHVRLARGTRLGEWCERQRRAYRSGMLAAERSERLGAVPGWTWDLAEQRWMDQYQQVRSEAERRGGLDLELGACADLALLRPEPRSTATTVGRWCAQQRQSARRGELDGTRAARLSAIPGWVWAAIPDADALAVDLLGEFVAWKGHANPPASFVEDDVALGRWINQVRRRRVTGTLSQALFDELAVVCPRRGGEGSLRWYRNATLWLLGLQALHQFVAREGHCRPPYSHFEELADFTIPLYDWCTRQRHLYRHGHMLAVRADKLAVVPGWEWERDRDPRVTKDIGDTEHGTRTGYVKGCHCDPCTEANRVKEVQRAARAAAGGPTTDLVDAGVARTHLNSLYDAGRGATQKALSRASGLNVKTIAQLLSGETKRILAETEAVICALTGAAARAAAAPGTRVDAGPTWELLDDMVRRGWPKSWIARELGLGASVQFGKATVTAENAEKVAALHRKLGDRVAPPRRHRQPVASLGELLAAADGGGADYDDTAITWAKSLLAQGYHVHRVAQRSGIPVEHVIAMAGKRFGEERSAS